MLLWYLFCSNFGRLVILIIISLLIIAYRSDTSFFKYFLFLFWKDFFQTEMMVPQNKKSCYYSFIVRTVAVGCWKISNFLHPRRVSVWQNFPIFNKQSSTQVVRFWGRSGKTTRVLRERKCPWIRKALRNGSWFDSDSVHWQPSRWRVNQTILEQFFFSASINWCSLMR